MPIRPSIKMLPWALVGLGLTALVVIAVVFLFQAWFSDPFPVLGMENNPKQPIDFPHTVHVQEAGIDCEFCHRTVAKADAATVPAVEQCLICHEVIDGSQKTEINRLLAYANAGQPINWERVHRMPDHVQFAHEPHVRFFTQQQNVIETAAASGISPVEQVCTICHGDVREMTKIKQERSLKMGDCVDCHRDYDAPTDCTTCHY